MSLKKKKKHEQEFESFSSNWSMLFFQKTIVHLGLYWKRVYAILWIEHNVTSYIYMHIYEV